MTTRFIPFCILLIGLIALSTGCQNKKGPVTVSGLKKIHFDFDRASIKPDMVPIMDANTKHLKQHKKTNIVIEGHCDERGTNEYNMALGDRRARAAENYFKAQGISNSRLRSVSFGEEKPLSSGHSEQAWYMNRRAEFVKE